MLVYLFVYAFMQLGAFAVLALMRRHDVVGDELKDLNGLFFRQPFAAVAMLLFMLSLGGIPPTAGFMGKFWLFGAAIESGYVWLAVIGVLNSAVSLYYYIRIVVYMMLKNEPAGIGADAESRRWRSRWWPRWWRRCCSACIRSRCSSLRRRRRRRWARPRSPRRCRENAEIQA